MGRVYNAPERRLTSTRCDAPGNFNLGNDLESIGVVRLGHSASFSAEAASIMGSDLHGDSVNDVASVAPGCAVSGLVENRDN